MENENDGSSLMNRFFQFKLEISGKKEAPERRPFYLFDFLSG